MVEHLSNISLDIHQAADAIGCSTYIIDRLFKEGRTGELVRNEGTGDKRVKLRIRVADLDDLKAIVQEHGRRQRAVKAANGEIIMNKLDALARAIKMIVDDEENEHIGPETRNAVIAVLRVGGFDLTVETPEDVFA